MVLVKNVLPHPRRSWVIWSFPWRQEPNPTIFYDRWDFSPAPQEGERQAQLRENATTQKVNAAE